MPHDTFVRSEIETLLQRGKNELLAAMSATPRALRRGDALVQMGETHEFLYAIESGWLARSRTIPDGRRQIIVIFLPGELCGIKTVFMERQPDDIEALTEAATRRIHYREAWDLASRNFAVAMHLAWQLALDERQLHNWNLRLGRGRAEERIAVLLLEMRDRLAAPGEKEYVLPLTQQQMADHLGLTPVHVNRILRRFREQDMVAIQKNTVSFLCNAAALEELARPVQDADRQ